MLKLLCEKADCAAGKTFDRRRVAAGRQIHFAPVRDAGGVGGRHERAAAFCGGGGLPQHAGLHERAWRGRESREGHGASDGARDCED